MQKKRFISLLLAFVMIISIVPLNIFAAEPTAVPAADPVDPAVPTKLNNVRETYIEELHGLEIEDPKTSSVSYDEKKPQEIYGYTYIEYEEETKHIFSRKDVTYIKGYPDKSVRGEANLTRAEASTIFYRLYEEEFPEFKQRMSNDTFSDVNAQSWFYKEVETLYNVGIIDGYDDGTFRPNDPVTRAEFATLAAKWSNLKYVDKAAFSDVPAGHWAYSYVNAAADVGWITGYDDGTYEPDREITRSETVSFINGVVNRAITVKELTDLKVVNPYNDLVESYWAYTELIEASVDHSAGSWHGTKYNDGKFNVIVEHFVDDAGKELAKDVVSEGKELYAYKEIDKHEYLGYITEITYVYTDNKKATLPYITKEVNKTSALVGEKITYTVTMGNEADAKYEIENAVMTDTIPAELDFIDGSVQVDGKTHDYSFDDQTKMLSVNVGSIKPDQAVVITFSVEANAKAYGKNVVNTAFLTGDNCPDKDGSDSGIDIIDGYTEPTLKKEVSKKTAKVGDTVTYTLTAGNDKSATVAIKNATITDILPQEVNLNYGSIQIDGKASTDYTYDDATRTLSINLGDIEIGKQVKASFAVTINDTAYGVTFQNLATLQGDDGNQVQDKDDGIKVDDGIAIPSITKTADVSKAKVGDTITYTVKVKNDGASSVNLKDAIVKDTIPKYLTFTHGSVLVDGYAWTDYSYDNTSKLLSVMLGEIAPNQTKTITFAAVVNSSAYGETFKNTAIITSSNAPDETGTDKGVTVDPGIPDGSAGTKSVDKKTAKVGDTVKYTIQISNGAMATGKWKNVTITDIIPDDMTFNNGSVEKNGNATTEYSFDAGTNTLTLKPADIDIGETVTFTFTVVVKDGAQGKFIVNTAVLHSDDKGDINLNDTGVQIDDGDAEPSLEKVASVQNANVGDFFTYTVTLKNKTTATATWKNVVFTDTIPTELKLVAGSVSLNGTTVSYGVNGQTISVNVGDLVAGDEAVIKFQVMVLDAAAGQKIVNTGSAKGDNGDKTGTDDGVDVPDLIVPGIQPNSVYGVKDVDRVLIDITKNDKVATFTITAGNNTKATWKDVAIYDVLDTSMLTLFSDSIYIDGIKFAIDSGKWDFSDKQFTVKLGDIEPGETKTIDFSVEFKSDAGNSTYTNYATLKGLDENNKDLNVNIKSPEITIIGEDPISRIHTSFFGGVGDANGNPLHIWEPNKNITMVDMCRVGYRLMTDNYKNKVGAGTITVPSGLTPDMEVQFMISHGVLMASEYTANAPATEAQIYKILNFCISSNLYSVSATPMKRANVAKLVCDLTGRDKEPDINGYTVKYFSDKGAYIKLIDEVSNTHDYMMDSYGNETWIFNSGLK